ncbi:sulfatase-like hydrolase/transferase [uncultured Acetobacteroides sp.]|uniref:LTA synthase family protein n=1 Tax=uncultured Acetobacteroides sp. TaxID=1760811 RepID=UPI0029F4AB83|nr:sulfatase-like hydrolase/transferase [uncultured Acetobacteroides sp.]
MFNSILRTRFKGLLSLAGIYVAIAMVTRTYLLFFSRADVSWNIWNLIKVYAMGAFYDIVSVSYMLIPFALLVTLLTDNAFYKRWRMTSAIVFYTILIAAAIFGAFAEYFFWEEFSTRFNFIAIDYLVYTSEVTNNIFESYNIPLVVSLWTLFTAAVAIFAIRKKLFTPSERISTTIWQRLKVGSAFIIFPFIAFFAFGQNTERFFDNQYNSELAKDGVYSLGSAYINNELDYHKFYINNDNKSTLAELRKLLATEGSQYTSSNPDDITRKITSQGEAKNYNVILICNESLSASFLGAFGNTEKLTPNLDSIAKQSMLFTNLYSTGTRTVRGMEAITLSIPPTPGSSIVRRPGNENLFTLGSVFSQKGYDTKFVYGGYGYFDNMNYFFGNNDFKVVDRNLFTKADTHFANAWGVCDGDLFNKVIQEADSSYASGKPFFQYVMTTSNHRPYTYPNNCVDIPSGSGREGAVKYTDYAMGQLIRDAKSKPWFKNTLIIIVADHCNNSAGKSSMNIEKYHIPFIVYNPNLVKPAKVETQCSQIDVAPTILGLMGWSYESKFFGKNILTMKPNEQRAFVGTYQKLGYLKGNKVVILDVQHQSEFFTYNKNSNNLTPASKDNALLNEAVAYYQGAYYLYKNGLTKNSINKNPPMAQKR